MAKFLDLTGLTSAINKIKTWATGQFISKSEKGAPNGVASLDGNGRVPTAQLPSYVDDVLEFESQSAFPETGEDGKIYVDETTNKTYRWSGTTYVEISASLALGETSSTAFPGDKGKAAYNHSQAAHAPANAEANVQSDWNETDTGSDAFIKNKPTSLPANGGNADTVNGHTVEANVPADAKFTDTVFQHPEHTQYASGLYKVTVDNLGHVTAATAVTKTDITGLGIPAQDTTYEAISEEEIAALFS